MSSQPEQGHVTTRALNKNQHLAQIILGGKQKHQTTEEVNTEKAAKKAKLVTEMFLKQDEHKKKVARAAEVQL